nr:MAG TPA: hypothetical protein [Caudoviricetes sp.]
MQYVFDYEERTYELPKFTKVIKNKLDQVNKDNAGNIPEEKKFKNMYSCIKDLVGDEGAKEIFGTDKFDDIDLNEIVVCYITIARTYDKPVNEVKHNTNDYISDEDRELALTLFKNAGNVTALEKALNSKGKKVPYGA